MSGNIVRYFAGGNTAKGFYSLYDTNVDGLKQVLLLTGRSQDEKSIIIERLIHKWVEQGGALEVIHRANHPAQAEGFIIREKGFAVIDAESSRGIGEKISGPQWETVDLEQEERWGNLDQQRITRLEHNMKAEYENAYLAYAQALRIHDDWEGIYIGKMNFALANQVTEDLLNKLFSAKEQHSTRKSNILRRFLGAATPEGAVDFVDNITAGLHNRYFLKGRAGTGKSTLLKKVVSEAENKGYDLEIYQCGFDPQSLDMVIIRELGWAVFDSTAPHEYFPERQGDSIIDMYELTVAPGTDEAFSGEIAQIEAKYREQMKRGKEHLAKAKEWQDQIEGVYAPYNNSLRVENIYQEIEKALPF